MACLKGKSFPLGATLVPGGANFSVFAKHSTGAQLLLFDDEDAPMPSGVIDLDPRANRTYHYWHVFVPGVTAGQIYGYRIAGPFDPERGCVSTATRYCSILTGNALPGRKDAAARPHGVRGTMPLRP
jgi:glycogen operon protein